MSAKKPSGEATTTAPAERIATTTTTTTTFSTGINMNRNHGETRSSIALKTNHNLVRIQDEASISDEDASAVPLEGGLGNRVVSSAAEQFKSEVRSLEATMKNDVNEEKEECNGIRTDYRKQSLIEGKRPSSKELTDHDDGPHHDQNGYQEKKSIKHKNIDDSTGDDLCTLDPQDIFQASLDFERNLMISSPPEPKPFKDVPSQEQQLQREEPSFETTSTLKNGRSTSTKLPIMNRGIISSSSSDKRSSSLSLLSGVGGMAAGSSMTSSRRSSSSHNSLYPSMDNLLAGTIGSSGQPATAATAAAGSSSGASNSISDLMILDVDMEETWASSSVRHNKKPAAVPSGSSITTTTTMTRPTTTWVENYGQYSQHLNEQHHQPAIASASAYAPSSSSSYSAYGPGGSAVTAVASSSYAATAQSAYIPDVSQSSIIEDELMLDYAYIPSERSVATANATASAAASNSASAARGRGWTEVSNNNNNRTDDTYDDDLLAMKRAAYGDGSVGRASVVATTSTATETTSWNAYNYDTSHHHQQQQQEGATWQGVQAESMDRADVEATVLDYSDYAHPSEQAVQAEFVCQGGAYDGNVPQHQDDYNFSRRPTDSTTRRTSNYNDETLTRPYDSEGTPQEFAAEATVISSGPSEKATQAAWSSDATEALVLESDTILEEDNIIDLDTKPPAQENYETMQQQSTDDNNIMSNRRRSVDQYQTTTSLAMDDTMAEIEPNETVATVVGYDMHPTEMASSESVQAEFLGRSAVDLSADGVGEGIPSTSEPQSIVPLENDHDSPTEFLQDQTAVATVVDSGPAGKATAEAWSTGEAEHAEVIQDSSVVENGIEGQNGEPKDDTEDVVASSAHTTEFGEDYDTNDVAEVVDITEEIHPLEYETGEIAMTAELVGTNSNVAVAVHSVDSSRREIVSTGAQAEAVIVNDISVSNSQQQQAGVAVAVAGECVAQAVLSHQSSSLSTLPERGQNETVTNGQDVQEATPVAVMAVEDGNDQNLDQTADDFYNYPIKPEPVYRSSTEPPRMSTINDTPRAVSEPISSETNGVENADEPAWTRAPSFGGHDGSEGNLPEPLVPPVATATAVVEDDVNVSSGAIPPAIPMPRHPEPTASTTSRSSIGSQRSDQRRDGPGGAVNAISNNIGRGANNVMEILFGDARPASRRPVELDSLSASVLPRTLLPSSVIYSDSTKSWVATVNTNQKALESNNVAESSKALRAFSVPTKKQAMCLARAWAPPKMHPFSENPKCFICETKFAVFRRACHCRNCGVCVCSSCSVQWPAKMLPATYNIKREGFFNVCKACDMLSSSFRLALLEGDFDKAIALHSTGNINLTTPFANIKGELFYPVHCAVIGGNLKLLKWLVDEHCCPLRSIRVSSGRQKDTSGSYTPILTSKGRSLLAIALGNRNIGIVRYLVVDKRMMLWAERDLSAEVLVQNLDLVLRILPEEVLGAQNYDENQTGSSERSNSQGQGGVRVPSDMASPDSELPAIRASGALDEDAGGSSDEECIICFSNPIDCVVTPCGHQICCLECSRNITRCPVCSIDCSFIRVFRA